MDCSFLILKQMTSMTYESLSILRIETSSLHSRLLQKKETPFEKE